MLKELIYIEHHAGEYDNGLQICIFCGEIICDYTGHWMSSDGVAPKGWAEGKIWKTGINPVQTCGIKPEVNYGGNDPYFRKTIKCTDNIK